MQALRVLPAEGEQSDDEEDYKKLVELKTIRPTALCVRDESNLQLVSISEFFQDFRIFSCRNLGFFFEGFGVSLLHMNVNRTMSYYTKTGRWHNKSLLNFVFQAVFRTLGDVTPG